jgi:hypothetical protein
MGAFGYQLTQNAEEAPEKGCYLAIDKQGMREIG